MICYNRSIHLSTHIAVHYHGYTVHQIPLYRSDQSQQSLLIAYWLPVGYTYMQVAC